MTARKDKTLADLGEWPSPKITQRSHKIIRHAYEQVLTACARLASFASGRPPRTHGPVDERQEALAADDLVSFAIHARRLIDAAQCSAMLGGVEIRSFRQTKGTVKIRTIINTLIHHQDIQIVRTAFHAGILAGKLKLEDILDFPDRSFSPLVTVRSDRGDAVSFEIYELIEMFQKKILKPIIELCTEHDLYLEELNI